MLSPNWIWFVFCWNICVKSDDTQVYISLFTADTGISLKQLGDRLSDISGWTTNNRLRLNANKTDFFIIGTSRQHSKLTRFFPTPILNHSITVSDTVRNIGVTIDSDFNFRKLISLTYRCCFYHIHNLRRIRRYISLSVAKTIITALVTSRLYYCNSFLYNVASKDILKLHYAQKCLARVVTRLLGFPILFHFWNLFTGSLFNLTSFSNSVLFPNKLSSGESSYLLSMLSLSPKPREVHFTCCLFPGLQLMLSLLLGIGFRHNITKLFVV